MLRGVYSGYSPWDLWPPRLWTLSSHRAYFGIWTMRGPGSWGEWETRLRFVEGSIQLTACSRMDQIINTLCLYTVENGLLTRFVRSPDNTEQMFQLPPPFLSSVAIVTSLGCVSDSSLRSRDSWRTNPFAKWLGMQSNLIFLAIHFVLAKREYFNTMGCRLPDSVTVYANSLLAT